MKIKTLGLAGTLESSDIMISVEPNDIGEFVHIELESSVEKQFGRQIRELILEIAEELEVKNALIKANDKGAIDYVIIARLKAAIYRAAESTDYNWRSNNA